MKNAVRKNFIFLAIMGFLLAPGIASAATLGFYNITANDPEDAAIGEAQLWVEVTEAGAGKVAFTFHNDGPEASSITDIYFDDGSLFGIGSIENGPGVSFYQDAHPSDLPGGQNLNPPFQTSDGFLGDSDPPVQPNGVNPGEWVSIIFDILPSTSFSDVLAYLSSTALRIGIHVQGFESGGSESFVNIPYNPPCIDNDGDGYGNPESPNCTNQGLDCDDSNPNVHPGGMEEPYNSEVCSDGLDNDCDGLVDIDDPGCWQCTTPDQCNDGNPCTDDSCVANRCAYTNNTNPCDDGESCTMNDVCSGGICSGVWKDADGDGYVDVNCGGNDCDDSNPNVNPGVTEGCCVQDNCFDGIDNDCDGLIDKQEQACNEWCMAGESSTMGTPTGSGSVYTNYFAILLVPLATILMWRRMSRRGDRM